MTQVLHGERIGKNGKIRLGCSAVILDETREKVLLTKRADNGLRVKSNDNVAEGGSFTQMIKSLHFCGG